MMGRSVHWMRPYVHCIYSHVGGTTACAAFEYHHIHMQESLWESHTSVFLYFSFCSCSLFEMIQNEFSSRSHQDQFSYLSQGEEESIEFNSHSIEQGTCFNVFVLLFNVFVLLFNVFVLLLMLLSCGSCQCGRPRILILFKCVMFGEKQSTKLSNTSVF